eukprot:366351-Chlamydomonas_euryale.AAC.11
MKTLTCYPTSQRPHVGSGGSCNWAASQISEVPAQSRWLISASRSKAEAGARSVPPGPSAVRRPRARLTCGASVWSADRGEAAPAAVHPPPPAAARAQGRAKAAPSRPRCGGARRVGRRRQPLNVGERGPPWCVSWETALRIGNEADRDCWRRWDAPWQGSGSHIRGTLMHAHIESQWLGRAAACWLQDTWACSANTDLAPSCPDSHMARVGNNSAIGDHLLLSTRRDGLQQPGEQACDIA